KPRTLPRQIRQILPQFLIPARPGSIPATAAIHFQQLASPALAHRKPIAEQRHIRATAHEPHPFFAITAFNISLSSVRSATTVFSRRCPPPSCPKRLASSLSTPPYF